MQQYSRALRLDFARLAREEQDRRDMVALPDGTGGTLATAMADLFRLLYGKAEREEERSFAHVLAEAAVASTQYEALRRRRGY